MNQLHYCYEITCVQTMCTERDLIEVTNVFSCSVNKTILLLFSDVVVMQYSCPTDQFGETVMTFLWAEK